MSDKMQRVKPRRTVAFTLIEVLIVIAIILVLMAIALPVFFRARYSAWRTDEISHLRQIAIAGQLYSEEYGRFPISTELLYGGRYGIDRLLYSRRDPYPGGFVNAYITWSNSVNPGNPPRPLRDHRLTFAGVGDFFPFAPMRDFQNLDPLPSLLGEYERGTSERQNGGWLVSIAEGGDTADLGHVSLQFRKPILRLTFEGGVIKRPNCAVSTAQNDVGYGPMYCFFDSVRGDVAD